MSAEQTVVERAAEVIAAALVEFSYNAGIPHQTRHVAQALADAGLLPTEVEWGAEGEDHEENGEFVEWAASLPQNSYPEAEYYVRRYGGHLVRRYTTPWQEVVPDDH